MAATRMSAVALKPKQPETPSSRMLLLFVTDREQFWKWQNACIDWAEWRESDNRNTFGIAPKMVLPLALTTVFVLVLYWPSNGDYVRMWNRFSPTALVDMARESHRGPFCSGPSYPDGKCTELTPESRAAAAQSLPVSKRGSVAVRTQADIDAEMRATRLNGWLGAGLFLLLAIAFLKPELLRFIFGVTEAGGTREASDRPLSTSITPNVWQQSSAKHRDVPLSATPPRFGRRGT